MAVLAVWLPPQSRLREGHQSTGPSSRPGPSLGLGGGLNAWKLLLPEDGQKQSGRVLGVGGRQVEEEVWSLVFTALVMSFP